MTPELMHEAIFLGFLVIVCPVSIVCLTISVVLVSKDDTCLRGFCTVLFSVTTLASTLYLLTELFSKDQAVVKLLEYWLQ